MIRSSENATPVVSYGLNPARAVLRFQGQHVLLSSKYGAVRSSLIEEATSAIGFLQPLQAPGMDVCLREAQYDKQENALQLRFDVLYTNQSKDAREAAKNIRLQIEQRFDTPSETGMLRSSDVRCLSVFMGDKYDPLSAIYYAKEGVS